MQFKKHVSCCGSAIKETFEHKQRFQKLPFQNRGRIFVVGSGSSFSNAIYFRELFQKNFNASVIVKTPYSFVTSCTVSKSDILIHITQEGKRNDNFCPVDFAKKNKMHTILFLSKKSKIEDLADEVYYFVPEIEKILVASMSYMSANALVLMYMSCQTGFHLNRKIKYSVRNIIRAVNFGLKKKFILSEYYNLFLYSGFGEVSAVEGALKINECLMKDAESYEIKHFSHGKHFNSWNKKRVFNILSQKNDKKLIKIYKGTIIEKHHLFNVMESTLEDYLSVFDHSAQILNYIVQLMERRKLDLDDIPVRKKIYRPHNFIYD